MNMKICFLGAGSTVFAKSILGDCILTPELGTFTISLHDIDETRLNESYSVITAINNKYGEPAVIEKHLDRRKALAGSDYIVNAIQVGGYKPCTVTDFETPKKYGLRQTIADTLGVGGIFRALRTIAVLEDFAKDIEELCPDALFLNYTNPMAILTGYLSEYTKVKVVGLCHSVQACVPWLMHNAGKVRLKDAIACKHPYVSKIGGINHQAWLLKLEDTNSRDMYPEVKALSLARKKNNVYKFMADDVRHHMMHHFGCYITESSEHAAEYMPYFIKNRRPDLIKQLRIPLDEYIKRCKLQIFHWKLRKNTLMLKKKLKHRKTHEFGSFIIKSAHTGVPYEFGGSLVNREGFIPNLPPYACVEIPMTAYREGFKAERFGRLPEELACLNRTNINAQAMAILAAKERRMDYVYMAVAFDPHTSSEMTLDKIIEMCDEMYREHHAGGWMPEYKQTTEMTNY